MTAVGLETLAASAAVLAARDAASLQTNKSSDVLCQSSGTLANKSRNAPVIEGNNEKGNLAGPPQKKSRLLEFPADALLDLSGSSSAEVRRMGENERALVHYKRRLRNRESAKRSRARRQATITELSIEIKALRQETAYFAEIIHRQALELSTAMKERNLYLSMLQNESKSTNTSLENRPD